VNWDHRFDRFIYLFRLGAKNQRDILIHILHHKGYQWVTIDYHRLEQHQS